MKLKMLDKAERRRLKEILSILATHGFKNGFTSVNNPENLRITIEELGASFIKIGQILSMRPDLLPDEYIREFSKLQDNTPPLPYAIIEPLLHNAYGKPPSEIFSSFCETPLACASIAVVHRATLTNGEQVVVKIMRPGTRETISTDLGILRKVAPILKLLPPSEVLSPDELANELSSAISAELDFINETRNLKKFYELNQNEPFIKVPKVHEDYSNDAVIVMEYLDGPRLKDTSKLLEMGYDLEELATRLIYHYLKQIFDDGFFHADPHSGNIFIVEDKIAYVDFGLVATLRPGLRKKLKELVFAVATGDTERLALVMYGIAIKKGEVNFRDFSLDIELIYHRYITDSLKDIESREFLYKIIAIGRKHKLTTPREVILLLKVLGTLESFMREFIPDLDPTQIFQPYFKKKLLTDFNIKNEAEEQIANLVTLLRNSTKIPQKFHELMNTMVGGRLRIQIEHSTSEKTLRAYGSIANRLGITLIIAALIIGSAILASTPGSSHADMANLGFFGAGALTLLLWLIVAKTHK